MWNCSPSSSSCPRPWQFYTSSQVPTPIKQWVFQVVFIEPQRSKRNWLRHVTAAQLACGHGRSLASYKGAPASNSRPVRLHLSSVMALTLPRTYMHKTAIARPVRQTNVEVAQIRCIAVKLGGDGSAANLGSLEGWAQAVADSPAAAGATAG